MFFNGLLIVNLRLMKNRKLLFIKYGGIILIRLKLNKQMLLITVFALIILGTVSMFWGVNGLTRNMKVTKVSMTNMDIKSGLPIQTKILSTTDSNEIKEILNILEKSIFYKTLPDWGSVPANGNDRLRLIVTLQSDNNRIVEYSVDSLGNMKIDIFNGRWSSKNVSILGQRDTKWFEKLKNLYVDKERNYNATFSLDAASNKTL
jgi:hypothetical protein